jgi:quercetin dioxygenase-like cupin family protein
MRTSMWRVSAFVSLPLSIALALTIGGSSAVAAAHSSHRYAYATAGVMDQIHVAGIDWKILLNESNLGGPELDMVEATFPAGMRTPSHTHESVEIIYVLSGTYEHEVNGKLYRLTPGMIGIVRPGDHVRHIVPKSGPAKVLVIWAPAGEPAFFRHIHGVAIPTVEPVKTVVSAP